MPLKQYNYTSHPINCQLLDIISYQGRIYTKMYVPDFSYAEKRNISIKDFFVIFNHNMHIIQYSVLR